MFPLMVENYTVDEIHELNAFLKTPLGQKNIVLMPRLMENTQTNMVPEIQSMSARIDREITERPRAAGY